ncbi:putative permease [Spiroplasma clarkii]|uniref:APC family permease n=1 Tax=Spiroplasma clarkii TaxID=2139 RepID=UPI000B5575B9|nr:APC family permease [Spiroplasma clarkii]ARU91207.1 putative permease [Spiroplasma clarkii]
MKTKKEELNLFNLIWIGFSFIAGITFTASFSTILSTTNPEASVGVHIYWIFALEGLIAFLCAWSFARLVQIHPQANGGGGQYARTAFNKFWGLMTGLLNYAVIPVIGMGLMVTMVRANFDNLSGYHGGNWGSWGSWGNLYLDLIAYALYMFASSIIFFGIKKYKYFATIIGYMTWGITILLIIFGLVAGFIQPLNDPNNHTGFVGQSTNIKLGFDNFVNTFTTCFFAFAGIETFITTGKNIKNRDKNMPIAIIVIMILTTVFYIAFTALVMFAVRQENWSGNPNKEIFQGFSAKWLRDFGSILVIVCTMLMRFNSSLQITLFGGATLEPLASQKFLPDALRRENKENVPVGGIIVTIIGFTITFILFILIPDIIQGATERPSPFDYATLSSTASILLISIYIVVIVAAITHGFKKNMKVKWWEYLGWFLTIGFIIFIFAMYLKGLITSFTNPYDSDGEIDIQKLVAASFQIIYFTAIVVTAVCVYYIAYKKD